MQQQSQLEMDAQIRGSTREKRFVDHSHFSGEQIGCRMQEEALTCNEKMH